MKSANEESTSLCSLIFSVGATFSKLLAKCQGRGELKIKLRIERGRKCKLRKNG
jgi:hypothetical protein